MVQGTKKTDCFVNGHFIKHNVAILLDVGCGTGFNLQYWSQFSGHIIGLDRLSGHSVRHQIPDNHSQTINSEVCALPVLAGSASVVVALDVLEHVPDEKMLAEVNLLHV